MRVLCLGQTVIKKSCGVFKAKRGLVSRCDPEKYTHATAGTDKVEIVGGAPATFHLSSCLKLVIIYPNKSKAAQPFSLFKTGIEMIQLICHVMLATIRMFMLKQNNPLLS